jgi:hypothetical protein
MNVVVWRGVLPPPTGTFKCFSRRGFARTNKGKMSTTNRDSTCAEEGIALKRAEGLVLLMDTPKGGYLPTNVP